jgi:hypothetical protein
MRERNEFTEIKSTVVTTVLFSLFITAFESRTSLGDVIDQRWEIPNSSYSWFSYSVKNGSPIGQEFTAGMNNITGVELSMDLVTNPPDNTATFNIVIRDDTIQGQILASGTNTFTSTSDEWLWLYFDFGGPVPLSVGNRYVIEASMSSGSEFWTWNAWTDADGIGLPGRLIRDGEFAYPDYTFGFRTYAVPEPVTILLLGLGAAIIRKKAKSKKQI